MHNSLKQNATPLELLGWHTVSQTARSKRKPKAVEKRDKDAEPTLMDQFVVHSARSASKGEDVQREEEEEDY